MVNHKKIEVVRKDRKMRFIFYKFPGTRKGINSLNPSIPFPIEMVAGGGFEPPTFGL